MNKRGPGRPPGPSDTRAQLLAIARRRFRESGYHDVSLRSIAGEAGVDVALISYHFGSKAGLFGAAMALAINPADVLIGQLAGPLNSLPVRLVRAAVTAWDEPNNRASLIAFVQAVVQDAEIARIFREVLERELIGRLAERIGGVDATRRAATAASQIAGLLMSRYVVGVEPLASMPADELAQRMAPALAAALAGPRPGANR